MITKGLIMTATGLIGIISTIIIFAIISKKTNNNIKKLVDGSVAGSKVDHDIEDKSSKYVIKKKIEINNDASSENRNLTVNVEEETVISEENISLATNENLTEIKYNDTVKNIKGIHENKDNVEEIYDDATVVEESIEDDATVCAEEFEQEELTVCIDDEFEDDELTVCTE